MRPEILPRKDRPSYVGYLPHHSVDPHGNIVLLSDNADGVPDTLGVAWRMGLVETEARTDAEVGAFASRLESILANFPDGMIAQFILRSVPHARAALDAWEAASRSDDPVLAELGKSRRSTLERLGEAARAGSFSMRRLEAYVTLVQRGTWPDLAIGRAEALRWAGAMSSAPDERVARAYEADRKTLDDLAKTVETLSAQSGVSMQRLDSGPLAQVLYEALNPVRSRTLDLPAALPGERLAERVSQSALEIDLDDGVVLLDDLHHKVVSVTHLPGVTRGGMLMRGLGTLLVDAEPDMDLVLNLHVAGQEELRRKFGADRRMATNQSRDAHQGPTMQPQLEELVQIERELAGGARVVSLRLHAIVRARSREEVADRARTLQAAFQTAGFRAIVEIVRLLLERT